MESATSAHKILFTFLIYVTDVVFAGSGTFGKLRRTPIVQPRRLTLITSVWHLASYRMSRYKSLSRVTMARPRASGRSLRSLTPTLVRPTKRRTRRFLIPPTMFTVPTLCTVLVPVRNRTLSLSIIGALE
jgi:hypothetical protein